MNIDLIAVLLTVVAGVGINVGTLVAFRVSLEHRLTKLETRLDGRRLD